MVRFRAHCMIWASKLFSLYPFSTAKHISYILQSVAFRSCYFHMQTPLGGYSLTTVKDDQQVMFPYLHRHSSQKRSFNKSY